MASKINSGESCYSITWSVNNFSYCWQKRDEAIASPIFSIDIPEETKWKLLLFPRGTLFPACIAVFLYREKDCNGEENIEIKYSLDCVTADGSIETRSNIEHIFPKASRWGSRVFLSREQVFITSRRKYLPQDVLTIRCKIKQLGRKSVKNQHLFARTIINVDSRSLLWTIEKFSMMLPDQKKYFVLKSASKEVLMTIELYLTGGQCTEEKINLNVRPGDRCMKFFTMKTFVVNAQQGKADAGEFECWCEVGKFSTFMLTLSKNKLMKDKNLYLVKDIFCLNLEFATSTGFAFEGVEKIDFGTISQETSNEVLENWRKCNMEGEATESPSALVTDLTSLLNDKSLCDVKLQTTTNIFPAHTSILGARSPVFRAMFSSDMKEKQNKCVDVSDLDDKTVHQFLLYLYTDKLEERKWEDVLHLYKAADKYAVISLKQQCSLFLNSNLNLENACKTLIFADMHTDEDLKIIAQDFILRNGREIFKTEDWKLLSDTYSKLALETTLRNWNEK